MSVSKYVEFNSDVLTPRVPRRIRMHMVGAIVGSRRYYEGVSLSQMAEWARNHELEASHLCRYVDYMDEVAVGADGTYNRIPVVRENKQCFAVDHLILEEKAYNRSRIGCPGGDACRHEPLCIAVQRPA
jgi:hypothetical protein